MDGHIKSWRRESFEHYLRHFFAVGFGVQWSLGKQDWVLLWCDSEFVVERVVPDFFHVIPVGDDTMFDGVFQAQNTPFRLCFITENCQRGPVCERAGMHTRHMSLSGSYPPSLQNGVDDRQSSYYDFVKIVSGNYMTDSRKDSPGSVITLVDGKHVYMLSILSSHTRNYIRR